jgi:hypothetical protein
VKAALILALSLSYTAPAFAQTRAKAADAAEAEIKTIFIPCAKVPHELQNRCEVNHRDLIRTYITAKSGDVAAMAELEQSFDPDADGTAPIEETAGIRHGLRGQACAWALTIGESTRDPAILEATRTYWQRRCAEYPPNTIRAINERAGVILYELRTNPAKRPRPLPPIDTHCMISEVPDPNHPQKFAADCPR